MTKFIAILGLAVIALLSPPVGKAQSVTVFRPSPFKIDKLSTRQDMAHTWVYGEITSNAKKEAGTVYILVRWFDKARRVVAHYTTTVTDLAPGKTLPFRAFAKKNPDIIRYDVAIERVRFAQQWSESSTLTASLRTNFKNFRPLVNFISPCIPNSSQIPSSSVEVGSTTRIDGPLPPSPV